MEVSERLDLLRQAAENLVKHLSEPQPGIFAWNAMLEELVEQIRFGAGYGR